VNLTTNLSVNWVALIAHWT